MNIELKPKLLILVLSLLIVTLILGTGCQEEVTQSIAPSTSALSTTLVPNVSLDVYLYAKQVNPTTIPEEMINASQDVSIESLAVWGVSVNEDFAFGIALILTSNSEASKVYDEHNRINRVTYKLICPNI